MIAKTVVWLLVLSAAAVVLGIAVLGVVLWVCINVLGKRTCFELGLGWLIAHLLLLAAACVVAVLLVRKLPWRQSRAMAEQARRPEPKDDGRQPRFRQLITED